MIKHILTGTAFLACLAGTNAYAQYYGTAEEAALQMLGQLPSLSSVGQRTVGLNSAQDAQKSGLDVPFALYMVQVDVLKAYDGSQTDGSMLTDIEQVTYPLVADGEARAAFGVHKTPKGWQTREISSPERVRLMREVRLSAMAAGGKPAQSFFVVRIPSLQMVFVAENAAQGLTLRSVLEVPEIGLAANTPISGKELFAKLVPLAQAVKAGQPPR